MKKTMCFILLCLLCLSLPAGIAPTSRSMGEIAVSFEEGSLEALVKKALSASYTDAWLEEFSCGGEAFALAYTGILSSLLPMKNFILSVAKDNQVTARSLETGTMVTFVMKEGRISALYVK